MLMTFLWFCRSVCVECVCGKKGSLGGIRQLFLQQLRQRRGRRQERVHRQAVSHHGNCDHRSWQGDPSTHSRCQKRAGIFQQVHTLQFSSPSVRSVSPLELCPFFVFLKSHFPFPFQTFPHTIPLPPSLFFLCYFHHSVWSLLSPSHTQSFQTSSQTVCFAWGCPLLCGMFSCSFF